MVLIFLVGGCEQSTYSEAFYSTALLIICYNVYSELLVFLGVVTFFWHFRHSPLLPSDLFGIVVLFIQCNNVKSQSLMLYCIFVTL